MRIWLIKKRWRRHTIAVVAFLRLKRTLADLRLVRKLYSAASFMVRRDASRNRGRLTRAAPQLTPLLSLQVLMANRPMLSLKRAREIRRRNAATKLQSHARAFVGANRLHQMKWAAFLLQVTGGHRHHRLTSTTTSFTTSTTICTSPPLSPLLLQRVARGAAVRKQHGGRLAEIRAKRMAEAAAKRAAEEEARKAKEREEIERIKQMARHVTRTRVT